MKRQDLVQSAARLGGAAPEAVTEFAAKRKAILAAVNARLQDRTDTGALIGSDNIDRMKEDRRNDV
jgi:hypothetical protein